MSAQTLPRIFGDIYEGYGANVVGGKKGKTLIVNNLDNSGSGSLREALKTAGPRKIKFNVSGTINLLSRIEVKEGFLTFDGRYAPDGGICIKGEAIKFQTVEDVIIQHIRFRPGADGTSDSLMLINSEKIIVNHCSLSWAVDEVFSISGSKDVTVQWCIISEALRAGAGYAVLITHHADRITMHHNLIAHCRDRVPYIKCGSVDYRNNIVYNPFVVGYSAAVDDPYLINYVGNMTIAGSEANKPYSFKIIPHSSNPLVNPEYHQQSQVFLQGNIDQTRTHDGLDEAWILGKNNHPSILVNREIPMPPVHTTSAQEALRTVLANAGARLPKRDVVDQRIIDDVINGTGSSIYDPAEVGGWPDLSSKQPDVKPKKKELAMKQ